MNNISLSVCIVVNNNADSISDALYSIKDIADEIIIVDTGSTDNTKEICKGLINQTPTIRLYETEWNDDFSAAKNEALKYATKDWIFFFEPEFVLEEGSQKLLHFYLKGKASLYFIKCIEIPHHRNEFDHYYDFQESNFLVNTSLQPLLFQNRKGIKFENRILESICNIENLDKEISEITIRRYILSSEGSEKKRLDEKRLLEKSLASDNLTLTEKLLLKTSLLSLLMNDDISKEKMLELKEQITYINDEIEKNVDSHYQYKFQQWHNNCINFFMNSVGDYKTSIDILIKASNIYGLTVPMALQLNNILLKMNRKHECLRICKYIKDMVINKTALPITGVPIDNHVLEKDYSWFLLASLQYDLGNYEAFEYYKSKIKRKYKYLWKIDTIKKTEQNTHSFLEIFEEESLNSISDLSKQFRLAVEYLTESEYRKAEEFYLIALKFAFSEDNILLQNEIMGQMLGNAKKLMLDEETILELKQELESTASNQGLFWYNIGKYYFSTGKPNDAIKSFQKALQIEENKNYEYVNNNQDTVDRVIENTPDEFIIFKLQSYLKILNELKEEVLDEKLQELEKLWQKRETEKVKNLLFILKEKNSGRYEKYVVNDYLAILYESENDYRMAFKSITEAMTIEDYELFQRKEKIYNKIFYKILRNTYNKFIFNCKEYEWVETLKEIQKIRPSVIIAFGRSIEGLLITLSKVAKKDALLVGINMNQKENAFYPSREEVVKEIQVENPFQGINLLYYDSNKKGTVNKLKEILKTKQADILLIDNNLSYEDAKKYFELFLNFVSDEGLIIFHNIRPFLTDKTKLFLEYLSKNTLDLPVNVQHDLSEIRNGVFQLWNELIQKYTSKEIVKSATQTLNGIGILFKRQKEKKIFEGFNFLSIGFGASPSTYIRSMYLDNIKLFKHCFKDLGIEYRHTFNEPLKEYNNIVFTPNSEENLSNLLVDFTYIPFQLEQLQLFTYSHECYMRLLKSAKSIWDYSEINVKYLNSINFNNVLFLPFGFHPKMEVLDFNKEKNIDILFFGVTSDRRKYILDELVKKGYKVVSLAGLYGRERDSYIEKSKIILNIHIKENCLFEEHRVSFLINNRCFVISEKIDYFKENYYGDGIIFCDYDKLIETCEFYLKSENADLRKIIAEKGYKEFSRNKMVDNLKKVLNLMK